MSLGAVLLIVIVGCLLVPSLQDRITGIIESLSKASVQGPASVAFNYWLLGTGVLMVAGGVYVFIQTKAARAAGVEPRGLEIQAPNLPGPPQFGVDSGIQTAGFTSKVVTR